MSEPLYQFGGLRFWTEREILARERISAQIAETIMRTLRGINQAWAFERVDTPLLIPRERLNAAYTRDDAFFLADKMGDSEMVLRAETTDGSYTIAEHLLRTTKTKPPFGVWQLGQSFRRELMDGASAANLRFNSFYQLEFQLIYTAPYTVVVDGKDVLRGTQAPIPQLLRDALLPLVKKITGLDARIVPSDRLPPYSEETNDIEVFWHAPTKEQPEWKEVCSMSQRTDFTAAIPGIKDALTVFEVAFGADRMVAVSQGHL